MSQGRGGDNPPPLKPSAKDIMTNAECIQNFVNGEYGKSFSLLSLGDRLLSYNTTIAQRIGGVVVVNATRYSVTTSKAQNRLRYEISKRQARVREIENVPINTYDLERYA